MTKKLLHKERMRLWETSLDNHEKWLDQETGLFAEMFIEERSCPACYSDKSELLFYKSGGAYNNCSVCSMVYTNPVFKDEYLEEYYETNHSVQSEIVESDQDFYRGLYNKGLQLTQESVAATSILDIGCSTGEFLNLAKEEGLETFGIELNKTEVEIAKANHTIFNCYLDKVERKFDIITMWDVFEHIKDGRSMLLSIKEHLTDDGCLFIQIPTPDSLAAKILQRDCNMFDGLEHVNLYTIKALNSLLDSVSMELVAYDTVISESKVLANYMNYEHPYLGSFESKGIFSEEYILENKLGYKIQAVIKPKK